MAISGTSTYTLTAAGIVTEAFSKIGVRAVEQAIQSNEMQDGITALNTLLKTWSTKDLHIWAKKEGVLFLDPGTETYLLSSTGSRTSYLADFISTTTTSAVALGSATIPVTSSTGMAVGDSIGLRVNADTRFWSTILTVDSATQVTMNDNTTAAVASGSSVFTYTTKAERPMRVLSARRKLFGSDNEIPVIRWARQQYYDQVNKGSQGTVIAYYYSPQLDAGEFSVWQQASDVDQFLRLTFYEQLDDITSQTQNVEFPQEWLECLIYNLAVRLGIDYDTPIEKYQKIVGMAGILLEEMEAWGMEQGNLFISPNYGGQRQ